jgi:hypothetical protein
MTIDENRREVAAAGLTLCRASAVGVEFSG